MLTTAVGSRWLRTNTVRVELLRSCRGTTRHGSDYEHRCGSVSMETRDLGKSEFNLHSVASCRRYKVMFRQRLSTKPADHGMTLSLHPTRRNPPLVTSCCGCHGSSRRETNICTLPRSGVEQERFRMKWTPLGTRRGEKCTSFTRCHVTVAFMGRTPFIGTCSHVI